MVRGYFGVIVWTSELRPTVTRSHDYSPVVNREYDVRNTRSEPQHLILLIHFVKTNRDLLTATTTRFLFHGDTQQAIKPSRRQEERDCLLAFLITLALHKQVCVKENETFH